MRLRHVLLLVSVWTVSTAHAFFDAPTLVPTSPVAGQTVSVSIRGGECDGIVASSGYPQITQDGNAIRILFDSYHVSSGGVLCNISVGTLVQPVGSYPAGAYTLQVDRTFVDFFGDTVVETLGTIPFQVIEARAVPALGPLELVTLAGLLAGLAIWNSRYRAGRSPVD